MDSGWFVVGERAAGGKVFLEFLERRQLVSAQHVDRPFCSLIVLRPLLQEFSCVFGAGQLVHLPHVIRTSQKRDHEWLFATKLAAQFAAH